MALQNFFLRILVLSSHLPQVLFGLGELNLYIPEGVLQFTTFNLTEPEHLLVFVLSPVLAVNAESLTCDAHTLTCP